MINFPIGNQAASISLKTPQATATAASTSFGETSGLDAAFSLAAPGGPLSRSNSIEFPVTGGIPSPNIFSLGTDTTFPPSATTNILNTSSLFPSTLSGFGQTPSPQPTTQQSFITPVYLPTPVAPAQSPFFQPVNNAPVVASNQASSSKAVESLLLLLAAMLKGIKTNAQEDRGSDGTRPSRNTRETRQSEESKPSGNSKSSNGKPIDTNDNEYFNFKQGGTGDCAVLSGIAAVAHDVDGKKILDDSIKANQDGSYTVTLKGTGETFQVSKNDMNNDKLSKGEPKVRALENAIKQHYAKKGDNFEGKGGPDIIKLLTGKETKSLNSDKDQGKLKQRLIELAKTDTDGFTLEVGAETLTGSETKGMHGYAVTKIDEANNTVTYENPWDAKKMITVSLDDFTRDLTSKGSGGVDYAEI